MKVREFMDPTNGVVGFHLNEPESDDPMDVWMECEAHPTDASMIRVKAMVGDREFPETAEEIFSFVVKAMTAEEVRAD